MYFETCYDRINWGCYGIIYRSRKVSVRRDFQVDAYSTRSLELAKVGRKLGGIFQIELGYLGFWERFIPRRGSGVERIDLICKLFMCYSFIKTQCFLHEQCLCSTVNNINMNVTYLLLPIHSLTTWTDRHITMYMVECVKCDRGASKSQGEHRGQVKAIPMMKLP